MNVRPLVPILLSAMLLTGCGNKYITKVGNKEIYKTNVEKISHNDTGDWVLSGTSDAPDNSKILVTNYDKESMDYGSNSSESAKSPASFAIVQDGKFKVSVDPVGLTDSNDQKADKKTKLLIFAVANYNKKWESVTIPKNIVNKARESQKPETVSISKSQEKYIKDLDKDISSSKSKNKNNSNEDNSSNNNDSISNSNIAPTSDCPNITDEFDISNMLQYSDEDLHKGVTIKSFYVKDIGADKLKNYHLLLTPKKNSNQYFLVVTDKLKKKIQLGDTISAQGMLNGSSHINKTQVNCGISENYLNNPVTLLSVDKIEKD